MKNERFLSFLMRSGLAVVFLYAGVDALLNPASWIGFLPQWLRAVVPGTFLLTAFSVFEILLALWLLSGKKIAGAAWISTVTLLAIVVLNVGVLDILFRDIAILFMSVALIVFAHDTEH